MSLFSKSNWLLATQWDNESLQYILARQANKKLTLVTARNLEHTNEPEYIAELLKSEMEKHNVHKPAVLVTLARSKADVIPMELPPSTDEELASLVPLQAMQQIGDATNAGSKGESPMLDYLALGHASIEADRGSADISGDSVDMPSESRKVLAVHPQAAEIESIRSTLQAADLANLARIAFRPLAPLSLATSLSPQSTKETGASDQRSLFITLQEQHADMLLIHGQRLLLNRSIRLPQRNDDVFVETMVSEIRRTEMVAPTTTSPPELESNSSIGQILAFGGSDEQETWQSIEQQINVPVQLVNPLNYLPSQNPIVVRQSGRFAPLVGTLIEHTSGHPGDTTINFLAPRRPVTPPSILKRFGVYAAAATALLALGGYFAYEQRQTAESQISQLGTQLKQEEKIGDKLQRRQRIALAVQQWQSDDVNCLDELLDLSQRFPSAKDAYIQRLAITPTRGGKSVVMQVRTRDQKLVEEFESQLRDSHHGVVTKPVSESASDKDFPWQFDATIMVAPRTPEEYRKRLGVVSPQEGAAQGSNGDESAAPKLGDTNDSQSESPSQTEQQP